MYENNIKILNGMVLLGFIASFLNWIEFLKIFVIPLAILMSQIAKSLPCVIAETAVLLCISTMEFGNFLKLIRSQRRQS